MKKSETYDNVKVPDRWGVEEETTKVASTRLITRETVLQQATQEVLKQGKKVIALVGGDPTRFPPLFPADSVIKYLAEAAIDGWNMYISGARPQRGYKPSDDLYEAGMYWGHPDVGTSWRDALIQEIIRREKVIHKVDYTAKDIFLQPGTTQAMNQLYLALLDPGDVLLGPEPTYQQYFFYAKYFKADFETSLSFEEDRWQPDVEDLRKRITKKTKAILIVNPNNPTGAVYDEKNLKKIVNVAGEYRLPIISDEIYDCLTFDVPHSTSIASISKDVPVLLMNGMSKFFAVTGWRVGYLAIHDPEDKIPHIRKTLEITTHIAGDAHGIATPVIVAATRAYKDWDKSLEHCKWMAKELKKRRDYTMERMDDIPGIKCTKPEGAFYAFPRVENVGKNKKWPSEEHFLADLIKEEQITFVAGSNWGPKQGFAHFRLVFLPKIEVLKEVFDRLERFMKKHSK